MMSPLSMLSSHLHLPLHSCCLRHTTTTLLPSFSPITHTTRTNIMSYSIRAFSSSSAQEISPSLPLPENRVVLGCGAACIDYLATVDSYPKPDDKIRSTSLKIQGGGNAGNALTCAAHLGLKPRLISKVANDAQGKAILEELEADGVDTSFFVVSKEGNSPFTYVIVDKETKTRTCIHTPLYPPMMPNELPQSSLLSALECARLVYFDGRLQETALVIGKEATQRNIPVLIDAEKKREGLDDLLNLADYVVCSARFPQEWTEAPSIPSALVSMLLRLSNVKFVIVTLGEDGCMMLERSINMMRLKANEIGAVNGILHIGTAENIPPSELIDTTGAGDAFIGAVLYSICADKPPEKMLPFAASVAAAACKALGARSGLPKYTPIHV
ncbi:Ketohexokinase [Thalictrum thalictroides]|uniref:Ketohexokinase n=1 Tax=Thalictrum thalictroides TaxID=46969 RepID=A0A7J6V0E9_THATH|nr:Ketohexokinase [Thalictrum thalictroides]